MMRRAAGVREKFKVEIEMHQGWALSAILIAMVMDRLTDEVRQETSWTMMFAGDIIIWIESSEQVEENLERRKLAL